MGLPSGESLHARHRDVPHRRHDSRATQAERRFGARAARNGLTALALLAAAGAAAAETLRIATWHSGLTRDGPGLLLQDILSDRDPQVTAALEVIAALDADVLLLTGIDWDLDHVALAALADRLAARGAPYPFLFALPPNRGLATGLDLNGDGRLSTPDDAQGWGRFRGERSMAILSRLPVDAAAAIDLTALLWRELPANIAPPMPPEVADVQRLSSTGHWMVPVVRANGGRLWLLAWSATPPVFDGEDDRNGRRNHDETALWLRLLDGALAAAPPAAPFVILGHANLDPADSEGRPDALRALLADPRLQDPAPRGSHGRIEPGQAGDPGLDTALFAPPLGGLRLDYVLPSAGLGVTGAGVLWSAQDAPLTDAAGPHRPVWVDIALPD